MINEFNPLENYGVLDTVSMLKAKKREIRNILKSYVGIFDVFSESIQNALDSIERRQLQDIDHEGHIYIQIDLINNMYTIVDNGTGFTEEEYKTFLAPNISFNKGNHLNTRGNKGVGSTYLAFGYNKMLISTKNSTFSCNSEIINGRNWVEDTTDQVPAPLVKNSFLIQPMFDRIDSGAAFTIEFGGDYSRPKDLKWHQAFEPEQWKYLLTAKTPLGILSKNKKLISVTIRVVDLGYEGEETFFAEYPYPHKFISACLNLDTHLEWQKKCIEKGADTNNIPSIHKNRHAISKEFTKEDLLKSMEGKMTKDNVAVTEFVEKYSIWAYGFFAYSTNVFDEINDEAFRLRKGYRLIRGGLQIGNNTMIQGDVLVIPLTSHIGYQNQTHIIVHLTNADPDLGRKGFQPEITDACMMIGIDIVNRLKIWRSLLRENTGIKGGALKEVQLYEWIEMQKKHKEEKPLILSSPHFFKPKNEISIQSQPQSEQDVIALFNQLLAGGVIRSIELLATSQIMQYDGVFVFKTTDQKQLYIYDDIKNPLGIDNQTFIPNFLSPPKVLEYKYSLDGLIEEFHNQEKRAVDVNLAIAWEMGDLWRQDYSCTTLLDPDNISHRQNHGITHILKNPTSEIQVIILSELIEYLNDPSSSKAIQNKYNEL